MRKVLILGCVLVAAVFTITATVWSDSSDSFYYSAEDWLIRAYSEDSGGGTFNVYIEVRDTANSLVDAGTITGLTTNPEKVADNATSPDVSLSFDPLSATAYVFYTDAGGLQLQSVTGLDSNVPKPAIAVDPTAVNFGNVTVGGSSDRTVTVSNNGNADLVLGAIGVTGTGFTRAGGTCADNQTLAPGASCTITVRFTPPSGGNFAGNLSVPSNDRDVDVPLSGTGVAGGNTDLVITSFSLGNCCENSTPFTTTITIKNQGTDAAGSFTVKGYFSVDDQIGPGFGGYPNDTLLFTWQVSGLNAGATLTNTLEGVFSGYPVHNFYYIILKVDADDQVAESDETNNQKALSLYIGR